MEFSQLTKKAKARCLSMQRKFNFKKLSDEQIIEKIKNWQFNADGSLYNPLIN